MNKRIRDLLAGAVATCLLLLSMPADAQTAVAGRDIWFNVAAVKARPSLPACASCHTNPATGGPDAGRIGATASRITLALTNNLGGMRDIFGTVGAILTVTDLNSLELYLANTAAVPSARAQVSPGVLSYPNTVVNTDSAALTVTLSHNTGSAAPFTLAAASAITLTGTNAADFRVSGGTCANGLAVATTMSCTIQVIFRPVAVGSGRAATLNIAFAENYLPAIAMPLVGNGVASPQPTLSLSATSISFPNTVVGATSAVQTVTLTNSGTASLDITSLTTGGANAAEFTRGGTCPATGSVAAGANCTITYTFAPTALGARAGTLTIASNNPGGNATLALSGMGIANTPTFSSTPATLTFNTPVGMTSAPQNVTVTNTGGGTLAVTTATADNAAFTVTLGNCAALTNTQSCTIGVTFAATSTTPVTGTLTINHNAGAAVTVALTGTGQVNAPLVAVAPATVTVAALTAVGQQSAPTTVRFTNNGPGPVTLTSATSVAEFPLSTTGVASPCTNGMTIAQAAFCQVAVRFAPSAAGARTGVLTFASNGSPGNATVQLAGIGSATSAPLLGYAPAGGPLFEPTQAGTNSPAIRVTITNVGTANMMFPASGVAAITTGFNPSDFRVAATTCVAATPLQPNTGNCTVDVTFAPTAAGAATRTAILLISHSGGADQVPLTGVVIGATGAGSPAPPPSTGGGTNPSAAPTGGSSSGGGGEVAWQWLGLLCLLALSTARRRRAVFAEIESVRAFKPREVLKP